MEHDLRRCQLRDLTVILSHPTCFCLSSLSNLEHPVVDRLPMESIPFVTTDTNCYADSPWATTHGHNQDCSGWLRPHDANYDCSVANMRELVPAVQLAQIYSVPSTLNLKIQNSCVDLPAYSPALPSSASISVGLDSGFLRLPSLCDFCFCFVWTLQFKCFMNFESKAKKVCISIPLLIHCKFYINK